MGGGAEAPLNVAIIGAGIGGLTAAVELRQNGHHVTLFEQSRFANEYGAAIHLAPNANGLLKRLGLDLAEDGGVPTENICEGGKDAEIKKKIPIGKSKGMWQHGWLFCHRRTLHDRLKRAVLSEEGKGKPARLLTSSKVESVTPEGAIELANGDKYQADVIIGADGVHSTVRKIMYPGLLAGSSGKNAYRFLLKKEDLQTADPEAYELVKEDGTLISYYDLDRRIVVFPADRNEWLNLVCMHPEELSDGSGEEWSRVGDKSKMLEIYSEFSPKLRAILNTAPDDSLKVWKLLDLAPLPSWTKDKLCLLGDAAHPFLPYNGQGGACAIEDAASIGVMLPFGTTTDEVPERLKLYEKARMKRADQLQEYSRAAGKDLRPDAMDMVGHTMAKLAAFAYGHDENHHSTHILREHRQSKAPNGVIWRSPIGFGPMPGPRQTFAGEAHETSQTPYKSISIRMKTSRTLLQNMLPRRDVLSFNSPGTVAEVTWKFQANDKVSWLGNRPYCHLSLYIHGVKCQKPDGSAIVGDYLAVMLEDKADPVVTGRDELGFPKLFCDLEMAEIADDGKTELTSQIKASWQGHTFITLNVLNAQRKDLANGVEAKPAAKGGWGPPPPPFAGIIVHRYVPAVGKKNEADADYIVCVPPLEGTDKPARDSMWVSKTASVKLDSGDWTSLPTLHHIVQRLRELPNMGIVEAAAIEGRGVSDHKGIYRVF